MDKVNKIIQLKQLVENGVLTEAEFNKLKNEIIDVEEDKNLEDSAKSDVSDNSLNLLNEIINNSTEIEGIYFIEDKDLVKNQTFISEISGWSGWSGAAQTLGEKNAMKKLAKKANEIGANVVLIISFSDTFGIKIIGNTYKIY
jgi:uncharacterized protein YbjQ (UPF0145 family)